MTQYRSTWVLASLEMLRERGHFDAYCRELAPPPRDEVLFAVAGGYGFRFRRRARTTKPATGSACPWRSSSAWAGA